MNENRKPMPRGGRATIILKNKKNRKIMHENTAAIHSILKEKNYKA
jgi:hypothetical protein